LFIKSGFVSGVLKINLLHACLNRHRYKFFQSAFGGSIDLPQRARNIFASFFFTAFNLG
jgi:hypothetical protein